MDSNNNTKKSKKYPWTNRRKGYMEALQYIWGRSAGHIKSFQTPWDKVNDAGVDGIEWNSLVIVGGRPGTGKTLIKDQLVREAFERNPGINLRVLQFEFEMVQRVSAIREFSSVVGESYKYVCSAEKNKEGIKNKITNIELKKFEEYAAKALKNPIDIVDHPCTVEEFEKTIHEYMRENATQTEEGLVYCPTVITADHSYLFKKALKDGSPTDMLYNLGETCTKLKRQYPLIIIMLSQLKREVDRPERNEDGKYGNYVLDSDILGGDALTQHADMIIGVNRPGTRFIKFYGVDRFIIEDDRTLVFHFLKCRNGDVRISFFRAAYERMSVVAMQEPGRQTMNLKTKTG